jgi:GNAT superfamily N-acetyltransferase
MAGAGPDLAIVGLTAADAEEVGTLLVTCDRATLPWAPAGWRPPREEDERDWWSERLDRTGVWSRGLRDPGDRLVGFVSMALATDPASPSFPPTGHISALFVHPDLWRRGHGARLLELAEAEIRSAGWARGRLLTPAWSPARAFYSRHGWLEDGVRDYLVHLDLDVVGLVKPLHQLSGRTTPQP